MLKWFRTSAQKHKAELAELRIKLENYFEDEKEIPGLWAQVGVFIHPTLEDLADELHIDFERLLYLEDLSPSEATAVKQGLKAGQQEEAFLETLAFYNTYVYGLLTALFQLKYCVTHQSDIFSDETQALCYEYQTFYTRVVTAGKAQIDENNAWLNDIE